MESRCTKERQKLHTTLRLPLLPLMGCVRDLQKSLKTQDIWFSACFFLVNKICINDSGAFQETAWTTNCANNSGGLLENSHIHGLSIWIPAKQLPQNSFSSDTSPLFAPWGHLSFLQWRLLQRVRVLEEGPKDVLRFKLQMTQWISDKLLQWALFPHSSLAWPFTSPPFHRTPVLFFWWRLDVHLCFFFPNRVIKYVILKCAYKRTGKLQSGGVSCNPEYTCPELNMFLSIAVFFILYLFVCLCVDGCSAGISHGFTKWIFLRKDSFWVSFFWYDFNIFFSIIFSPPPLCTFLCVRLWVYINMYIYCGWPEVGKPIFFNSHISEKRTHRKAFKC